MRDVSADFLAAVGGSNSPVFWADVWYGSDIIREGVEIAGGQVSWDSANAVEDRCSLTLVDIQSSGSRLRDIIHAYGCRVNVRAGFDLPSGAETVSLGWFDITDTDAVEEWRWFDWRAEAAKISEVVKVEADGLLSVVARSDLFGPYQPPAGADAWATIQDLCLDVVSVLDPGFTSKALPSGDSAIVFDTDRLAAIRQVANLWGAIPVITEDGQLTLVMPGEGPETDPYGLNINVELWRNQTASADLYNGVAFKGKSPAGVDLWGYATEDSGPLFWGGPFGRRPLRAASDLMTTQAMVNDAATTRLTTMRRARSAVQTVKALWNPAQELRDRPVLQLPDREVQSEVAAITLPFGGGPMDVTLRLPLLLEA